MADRFVFVVRCHQCDALIKVADDPTAGTERYVAEQGQTEELTCPTCGETDRYQATELRRVRAERFH
jgi:RNase P subunit RPR2